MRLFEYDHVAGRVCSVVGNMFSGSMASSRIYGTSDGHCSSNGHTILVGHVAIGPFSICRHITVPTHYGSPQ